MKSLNECSAIELLGLYQSGEASPVEATKACFEKISRSDSQINAFCVLNEQAALLSAKASELRWRSNQPQGPLDGVPIAIKDLIVTKGLPTLRGSKTVDAKQAWVVNAPATQRILEAGGVLIGKTTTPEFGWRATTDSALQGITRNPLNLALTPGGSSGGSAAAVAANMVPLAVGTDGGGSIRIPAAFTGTVGIKPHYGRVPAYPMSPMGNVAHIGPHARGVADAALLLNVLAGADARDWTAMPAPSPDWRASWLRNEASNRTMKGLRIAYSPDLGYVNYVDPLIKKSLDAVAQRCADAGAIVEQPNLGITDSHDAFCTHWFSSARQLVQKLTMQQFSQIDPGLQAMVNQAERYQLSDYLDAQAERTTLALQLNKLFDSYDVLLTPATAVLPFEAGLVVPDHPKAKAFLPDDWTWWTPFSFPFNLTQQPAIVQPAIVQPAFDERGKLPVGVQWVAANHREDMLVAVAAAYESLTL